MRVSRLAWVAACAGWAVAAGCAATSPPLPTDVTSPIVSASTSGGCPEPSHKPLPEYGIRVPFTSPPRSDRKVAPVYPDSARKAGVDGKVVVAALVCEHGRVLATRVIESIALLDAAATEAARQWEFKPALIEGVPVATWTRIPIGFSLR